MRFIIMWDSRVCPRNSNPPHLINWFFFLAPQTCLVGPHRPRGPRPVHATNLDKKSQHKKNPKTPRLFINLDQKPKNKNPRILFFNWTKVATKNPKTNTKISYFLFSLSKSQTQTQILTQTQTQKSQTQTRFLKKKRKKKEREPKP